MIYCVKNRVTFEGTRIELQAELTTAMHILLEEGVCDKEMLIKSVELACKTSEELDKDIEKRIRDSIKDLVEKLLTEDTDDKSEEEE